MYYFKDTKSLRVVTRDHQFNMEVVDGKLIEIDPTTPCLLLAHVPNKAWSYDVSKLERLDAQDGINKLNPLPQKSDKPQVFYAVILEQDYNTYMTDYAFREVISKTKNPKPEPVVKTEQRPIPSNAKTIDGATGKTINSTNLFDYSPSLTRSNEKTVYKFKSGSQKYG